MTKDAKSVKLLDEKLTAFHAVYIAFIGVFSCVTTQHCPGDFQLSMLTLRRTIRGDSTWPACCYPQTQMMEGKVLLSAVLFVSPLHLLGRATC